MSDESASSWNAGLLFVADVTLVAFQSSRMLVVLHRQTQSYLVGMLFDDLLVFLLKLASASRASQWRAPPSE